MNPNKRSFQKVSKRSFFKSVNTWFASVKENSITIDKLEGKIFNPSKKRLLLSDITNLVENRSHQQQKASSFNSIPNKAEKPLENLVYDIMLLGSFKVGKHTLIESLFPKEKIPAPLESSFDFLAINQNDAKSNKKYKFWIRDENEKVDEKFEMIFQIYYSKMSHFIFVYDTHDMQSFVYIEKSIKRILEVIPISKFSGILIGNNRGKLISNSVSRKDALSLKQRYGFLIFIEADLASEDLTEILYCLENNSISNEEPEIKIGSNPFL